MRLHDLRGVHNAEIALFDFSRIIDFSIENTILVCRKNGQFDAVFELNIGTQESLTFGLQSNDLVNILLNKHLKDIDF